MVIRDSAIKFQLIRGRIKGIITGPFDIEDPHSIPRFMLKGILQSVMKIRGEKVNIRLRYFG